MADPIIFTLTDPHITYGYDGMTLVSKNEGYKSGVGKTFVYRYSGPAQTGKPFYDDLIGDDKYDEITFDINNGMCDISVTVAQDASTITIEPVEKTTFWSIAPVDNLKPIETAFVYKDMPSALIERVKMLVINSQLYADPNSYLYKIDVNTFLSPKDKSDLWSDNDKLLAKTLYYQLLHGFTQYNEPTFVLRKSLEARGASTTVRLSWEGVGTAQNEADLGLTGAYQSAIIGTLSEIPNYTGNLQFLKRPPTLDVISKQVWRVTQEWQWASHWSKKIYGGDWNDETITNDPPFIIKT